MSTTRSRRSSQAIALLAGAVKLPTDELRWLAAQCREIVVERNGYDGVVPPTVRSEVSERDVLQQQELLSETPASIPTSTIAALAVSDAGSETLPRPEVSSQFPTTSREIRQDQARARASGVQAVLATFHDRFVEEHGSKPDITARDGKLAKDLVARHGTDEVIRVVGQMFDSSDAWIARDHSLPTLSRYWNRIISAEHAPTTGSRTAGNVVAARRALDRIAARERDRERRP